MDSETTHNTIAKISLGMDGVFATAPVRRGEAFAGVAAGISQFLAGLERIPTRGDEPDATRAANTAFAAKARIYVRALKTYPAASEEWLEVFWAFRKAFDQWVLESAYCPATPVPHVVTELERLRHNPYLILKT